MRDDMVRSIAMQALCAVAAGVALLWLASLLPTICPAMIGGPPCGPGLRQSAASLSTLAVIAVGVSSFAAALLAPRHRRQWVFGWGTAVLGVTVLLGLAWVVVASGFIIV